MGDRREAHRRTNLTLDREPSNNSASDYTAVEDDADLTPAMLEDIKATFHLFDQDNSGTIDPKEIRTQMRGLGFEADNTTIYTFINDLDSDGSQTLEFEEFCSLMKDHLRIHEPTYNARENIAEIFDFMDNPDPTKRNGRIDASCLRFIARALGDELAEEELEAMLKGADRNGKGHVDAEDFYELMVRGASRSVTQRTRRNNIMSMSSGESILRRGSRTRNSIGSLEGGRRRHSANPMEHRRSLTRLTSRESVQQSSKASDMESPRAPKTPKVPRSQRDSRIQTVGGPRAAESAGPAGRPTSGRSLASLASCSSEGSVRAASALMSATLSPAPLGPEDVPPGGPAT